MASNIVEILIGAKDDAKLDLDSLRTKLAELARTVAEAKVKVAGDKEAELALDRLGVKLLRVERTVTPKIKLEGQFKALAELSAVGLALDRVKEKADGGGTGGGLVRSLRNLSMGGVTAMESLGSASISFINPITVALAALALVIAGPLLASLAPITLGFAAFGAGAVGEIKKIVTAHQQLQAAQQAYEKATTRAGRQSALKAEKLATEDLSGSEKGLLGMLGQLGQMFHKLQAAVQPQVIRSFASVLKIIKDLMPTLIPLAVAAGKAIAGFLHHIDSWLRSDSGKKFLQWMRSDGPNAIKRFGQVMWDTVRFIGEAFSFLRNAGDTWWKNFHATVSHVMHAWNDTVHAFQAAYHAIASVFDGIKSTVGGAVDWIVGKIHTLTGALGSINGALGGIPGKILSGLGFAAGGIVGAASGGIRSNLTMVGEHGPELVQLSAGSRVYNNSQTMGMLGGGGGGPAAIMIDVRLGGVKVGHAVIDLVQNHVRTAGGGDVQVALGTS